MYEELLQNIGLTEGEIKVYFALVKLGLIKTGTLSKEAEVSSSKVYKILDRLEKKGLAGHVVIGKVKHFKAMPLQRILAYLEDKEKDLEKRKEEFKKIIPKIEESLEKPSEKSEAVLYEGFKACTNFFKNIIDELKKGEIYYVIGAGYGTTPGLREFFYNHHTRRAKKGIKLKMLANRDTKNNLESTTKKKAEIKYLPSYLITNMEIVFYKSKVFIVLWTRKPVGFLLESNEAVESFKGYFNAFWKLGKK